MTAEGEAMTELTLEKLKDDMKNALKAGEKTKLSTVRMLISEVKYGEIRKGEPLTSGELVEVVSREIKKRREAIPLFRQGDRLDLVEKEENELAILEAYLPEQLSAGELEELVDAAVGESDAESIKDIGKVMAILMPKVKGKADGSLVSKLVRDKLEG